jgi:hypothetical protein
MRSRLTGCATKFGPLSGRQGVGAAALVVSSTSASRSGHARSQSVCLLTQCGEGSEGEGGYCYNRGELVGQPSPPGLLSKEEPPA